MLKQLPHNNKKSIQEFNSHEARGWIIEEMGYFEQRLDKLIINHFKIKDKYLFQRHILNSSILDLGKKIKILVGLNLIKNKIADKLRQASSIRNTFAHSTINDVIHVSFHGQKGKVQSQTDGINTEIEVMNSDGKVKSMQVSTALEKFFDLRKELIEYFDKN